MGHQLKSFDALRKSCKYSGFSFPLACMIDFRGLRLLAYSSLPITEDCFVYGHAGGTFHDKNAEFSVEMKRCAKLMNVKSTYCGAEKKKHKLVGGFGCQGYLGLDARFYLLQVADFFPCSKPSPMRAKGSENVTLFRPEFVRSYPVALSSGAY